MESLPRRRSPVSPLILDSSATLAWIYGDETTEAIRRVFDAVADNGALVPALWRLEVANSLNGRPQAPYRSGFPARRASRSRAARHHDGPANRFVRLDRYSESRRSLQSHHL